MSFQRAKTSPLRVKHNPGPLPWGPRNETPEPTTSAHVTNPAVEYQALRKGHLFGAGVDFRGDLQISERSAVLSQRISSHRSPLERFDVARVQP